MFIFFIQTIYKMPVNLREKWLTFKAEQVEYYGLAREQALHFRDFARSLAREPREGRRDRMGWGLARSPAGNH